MILKCIVLLKDPSSHFTSKDMSTFLVIQNQNSDGNSSEHLISEMHNKISIVIYRYQSTGTESKHSLCLLAKLNIQVINSTFIHSSTNQYQTETVHMKGYECFMGQSMINWRKLFFLFLKSAKINHHKNVPKDINAKINSCEKKLFYSILAMDILA